MKQSRLSRNEGPSTAAAARSKADGGRRTQPGGETGHRGPRRWWFRPLALGIALAFGLLIGELGLRVFLAYTFSKRLGEPVESVPNDSSADVDLAQLVYRDRNPKIFYRFKPGAQGRYLSMPVQINSEGLPDDEFADEKPPGTLRIIGLGDSTMFGFGIYRHDRYMDIVEAKLGKIFAPDFEVEVLVNATPGWMAIQEIAAYHDSMLDLDADVVVIQFDPNDVELPSNLYEPDFFRFDRAFLGALSSRCSAIQRMDGFLSGGMAVLRYEGGIRSPNGLGEDRRLASARGARRRCGEALPPRMIRASARVPRGIMKMRQQPFRIAAIRSESSGRLGRDPTFVARGDDPMRRENTNPEQIRTGGPVDLTNMDPIEAIEAEFCRGDMLVNREEIRAIENAKRKKKTGLPTSSSEPSV